MDKTVTEDLTDEEIDEIKQDVIDSYGVNEDDVTVDVSYDVNGDMTVTIPEDGPSATELEDFIATELADILGIDKNDITVSVDPETGVVTYEIDNDSYDDATGIQDLLNDPATLEELNRRLAEEYPGTEITENNVDPDVEAEVEITVDTEDATNDPETAGEDFSNKQDQNGWETDTQGKA